MGRPLGPLNINTRPCFDLKLYPIVPSVPETAVFLIYKMKFLVFALVIVLAFASAFAGIIGHGAILTPTVAVAPAIITPHVATVGIGHVGLIHG